LLRDNIYSALRMEILTCRLLPGQEVNEQGLAAHFAVSRSPVREALLRLERENLVTVLPRQGYRIRPISVADAGDLFEFRMVVEPACAKMAAGRASDATLIALDRFRRPKLGDFIEYNRGFHRAVAEASGNRRMALVACDLIEQADRFVRVSIDALEGRDTGRLVREHEALIDALQARDGRGAGRISRAHTAGARARVLSALRRSAVITGGN